VLFIAFGALAVLVSRYALVCSIGTQNNALKKNIDSVQAQMDDLKLRIEFDDDLNYVQDTAQNELGMTYPTPDQKIHVDLSS
jgi:cell division protein FtsB